MLTNYLKTMQKYLPVCLFFATWLFSAYCGWSIFLSRTNYRNQNRLEKNLLLFSENALYYSFYNDLVNAPTLGAGISALTNTDKIQYPDRINVIREYNISPEIILASLFRFCKTLGMAPDSMDFYLFGAFLFSGLTVGLVFLASFIISKSVVSGLASVLLFVTSWPFSIRTIFFPALRENFTVPLLLLTLLFFYLVTENRKLKINHGIIIGVLILVQLLFWQFSLYTVIIAVTGLLAVARPLQSKPVKVIIIIAAFFIIGVELFQGRGLVGGGGHVVNYFFYRLGFIPGDFHSMLYFCDGVFDGLNAFFIQFLTNNLLLVLAIVGGVLLWKKKENRVWLAWAIGYGLMALLANRFLVLAIPVWCVVAGEVVSSRQKKLFHGIFRWGWLVALVTSLLFVSLNRLESEAKTVFVNNPYLIDLVNWIDNNTDSNSVFSASMSLNSAIRLAADRKITNNPFYEDSSSRRKNFEVYQVYNQTSEKEAYDLLRLNLTDYLVLERGLCFLQSNNGCQIEDLFVNEHKSESLPTLCRVLSIRSSPYFRMVYSNSEYHVFQVGKQEKGRL